MRALIRLVMGLTLAAAFAAIASGSAAAAPVVISVPSPAPHTPVNTPYVADGRLLTIEDADGDEVDVRITLDRGTIALGAAPGANVVDAGGDRDARVIGTPAQVKPALDNIVITPDLDDQREITGSVWVYQNGSSVAGHSLHLIVDAPVPGGAGDDRQPDSRTEDVAPRPRGRRSSDVPAAALRPVARVSVTRAGQRIKVSARGSKARRGRIVSYRWTGPSGRVLSRKATLWLKASKRIKVTLAVVDSDGRAARTALVVKPRGKVAGRA